MANLAIAKEQGAQGTLSPRQVAEAWFASLEQGNLQDAQAILDENVVWENILERGPDECPCP